MNLRKGTRPVDLRRDRILTRAHTIHVVLETFAGHGLGQFPDGAPTLAQVEAVLFADDRIEQSRREHGVTS